MTDPLLLKILSPESVLVFLLISIRFVGLIMAADVFRQIPMPQLMKASLPFMIALLLYPLYGLNTTSVVLDIIWLGLMGFQEIALGAAFGFSVNLFSSTVQFAGHLISTQMGLEVTEMVDPATQTRSPITGRLYYLIGLMLFLSLGLHRLMIETLAKSFDVFPPGQFIHSVPVFMGAFSNEITLLASAMFSGALSLALPVFGALIVVDVALALVAKTVPQMNIFMISMPLKVLIGTGLILITLPTLGQGIHHLYNNLDVFLPKLLAGG